VAGLLQVDAVIEEAMVGVVCAPRKVRRASEEHGRKRVSWGDGAQ
jgi:hypothetical protein